MRDLLEQLVNQITQPFSPTLRNALLAVDRGRFVPYYHRREGKDWIQEATSERAYQDSRSSQKLSRAGRSHRALSLL